MQSANTWQRLSRRGKCRPGRGLGATPDLVPRRHSCILLGAGKRAAGPILPPGPHEPVRSSPAKYRGTFVTGVPSGTLTTQVGKLRPRRVHVLPLALRGACLFRLAPQITVWVHTYPTFLYPSFLLPSHSTTRSPIPWHPCPALASASCTELFRRNPPAADHALSHAPSYALSRPPNSRSRDLLPLATLYTVRALPFAEPVSA